MVTKAEARTIWEYVKDNHRKLDACAGPHVFVDITPENRLNKRWRCTICGGEVSAIDRAWYMKGLEHGRSGR